MSLDFLVEVELAQHDWSQLAEANGNAEAIPEAFRELLSSKDPSDATKAYWKLENHVAQNGNLHGQLIG